MVKEKFRFYAFWLCLICIIVFVIQVVLPGFTEFFLLNSSAISNFEVWRFLTSIFLHGSVIHLMYNLFALALFGSILEKFVGGKKFLFVFFVSGILANLIAVNFYSASLGASGAIYGILGCLVILKPLMIVWAFGFPMPMFIAGILWVAGSVLGIFVPREVGDIAHLSGMAAGFLFGFIFRVMSKKKYERRETIRFNEPDMRRWEERYILRS